MSNAQRLPRAALPVALAATLCALATTAALARPQATPALSSDLGCVLHHEVTYLNGFAALPDVVQQAFKAKVGVFAMQGEPYRSADFTTPETKDQPTRKFIRALFAHREWIIWYEHGGYVRERHVVAFNNSLVGGLPATALPPSVTAHFIAFNYCAATDAILDGVTPAGAGRW